MERLFWWPKLTFLIHSLPKMHISANYNLIKNWQNYSQESYSINTEIIFTPINILSAILISSTLNNSNSHRWIKTTQLIITAYDVLCNLFIKTFVYSISIMANVALVSNKVLIPVTRIHVISILPPNLHNNIHAWEYLFANKYF